MHWWGRILPTLRELAWARSCLYIRVDASHVLTWCSKLRTTGSGILSESFSCNTPWYSLFLIGESRGYRSRPCETTVKCVKCIKAVFLGTDVAFVRIRSWLGRNERHRGWLQGCRSFEAFVRAFIADRVKLSLNDDQRQQQDDWGRRSRWSH